MSYSVSDLKNDTVGEMHGTTSNQVQNFDGVINRAARQLLLDVDPQETKRQVQFVNPIFNTVFDYPIAADVKGNKIIDIYPQVQRLPFDIWTQAYNQFFDVAKQNIFSMANMFTVNFNTSIKTLRINAPFLNAPMIVNQADDIDDNGTWSLTNGATNLTVNNTNFAQGAGSLQFDIAIGNNGIQNSTMSAVSLTAVENQASFFIWVYMPSASDISNVFLRWGSSPTNYNEQSESTTQQNTAFQNGWNLIQFDWNSGNGVTGTPDFSAVDYIAVVIDASAAMTAVKVNGINCILGTVLSYSYYSKYLFRNASTGTYQEKVLDDADLINLDTESYNLLTYQVLYLVSQQMQGLDASFYDGTFAKNAYDAGVLRYKSMYKSELQKPQSIYYQQPQPGYNRLMGFNNN